MGGTPREPGIRSTVQRSIPAVNIRCEEGKMAGIRWEREFEVALEKAKRTGKPVFQDFWFKE